jgi:hypothetical protein
MFYCDGTCVQVLNLASAQWSTDHKISKTVMLNIFAPGGMLVWVKVFVGRKVATVFD